jgi:three-Cys-motif partner protein
MLLLAFRIFGKVRHYPRTGAPWPLRQGLLGAGMARTFSGSVDTKLKLDCLREYLTAFSIALKNEGFARIYIDAFAGSGDRTEIHAALPMFGTESEIVTTPGSARIAFAVKPALDTIVLIEKDPKRFATLEKLRKEFADREVVLRNGDANELVQRLCRNTRWRGGPGSISRGIRGVIFLDPFGMEVDWKTVQCVAETRSLDCWFFFPLSGLYRNAPRRAVEMTSDKRSAITRIFGTEEWYDRWYAPRDAHQPGLFDDTSDAVRTADVNAIENYVKDRLSQVFKGVVLPPLRLRHNGGAPMASLFFAVSNDLPAAVKLATKIASHILKPPR